MEALHGEVYDDFGPMSKVQKTTPKGDSNLFSIIF